MISESYRSHSRSRDRKDWCVPYPDGTHGCFYCMKEFDPFTDYFGVLPESHRWWCPIRWAMCVVHLIERIRGRA